MSKIITRSGFSLIEVNLAIFIIAMGMLTLFSLFPSGLRQAESASESTQEALFAEDILATVRATAMGIDAITWTNKQEFVEQFDDATGNEIETIPYPLAQTNQYMRYMLTLTHQSGNWEENWVANLWCRSGEFGATDVGNFKENAAKFYTELFYSGMP